MGAGALAIVGGAAAARVPTFYVVAFLSLVVVAIAWIWQSGEAIVPFLLLVAAMQGGGLLELNLGNAPINTLMPLLGGWAVLAVLFSRQGRLTATRVSGAGRLLSSSLIVLGVIIVITAGAQVWRSDGRTLSVTEMLTLVQLGVLVALTAYLLSDPRRVLWVGYVTMAVGGALSVVALLTQAGVATSLFQVVYSGSEARSSGLVGDPNYFSFQLLLSLAFAANLSLAAKTNRGRIVAWPVFVVIVAAIVTTYSAGALVGLGAVLGGTVLLQLKVSAKRALAAFGLIVAATLAVALFAPAGYGSAVFTKYEKGVTSGSFEEFGTGRGAAWEAALREVESNPVLGVGLGGDRVVYAVAEYYTYSLVDRKAAHNMYLSVAVGAGIFGLAAFLVILAACFGVLWGTHSRAARGQPSEIGLAAACLFTALLVVVTQGLTLSLEYEKFVWLIVGACLAIRYWSVDMRQPATGS